MRLDKIKFMKMSSYPTPGVKETPGFLDTPNELDEIF